MKILITGSEGFIGTHLREALEKDHELICLDKKESSNRYSHEIDMSYNLGHIKKLIKSKIPEVIIHLAAVTNVNDTLMDVTQNNILSTVNLLEACKGSSVKKIIFSSSCAVYGRTLKNNKEIDKPSPENYYGQSKLIDEMFIKTFCKQNNINYQILRFGNVYGVGGHGVINVWLERIQHNLPLEIYGDGHQLRDYIFVDDIVAAIKVVMGLPQSYTMNVGTGKENSLWDVIKILKSEFGNLKTNLIDKIKGDIRESRLDITRLKKAYDWKPTNLKQGIKKSIGGVDVGG